LRDRQHAHRQSRTCDLQTPIGPPDVLNRRSLAVALQALDGIPEIRRIFIKSSLKHFDRKGRNPRELKFLGDVEGANHKRLATYLSDWFKSVLVGAGVLPCGLRLFGALCNELRGHRAQLDGDVYFDPVGVLQWLIERMTTVLDRSEYGDGDKPHMELQALQEDRDRCETNALQQLPLHEDVEREISAWISFGHASEFAAVTAVHWVEETICPNDKCSAVGRRMWHATFLALEDESLVPIINMGNVVRSRAEERLDFDEDSDEVTAATESCKACGHEPPKKVMRALFRLPKGIGRMTRLRIVIGPGSTSIRTFTFLI
jgi:hypothetical protein